MQHTNNNNYRTCILILGMHRSGTSAIAGCLNVLGFDLGKGLIPPGKPNEKGYFENVLINRFNDSVFELLYARWNDTLFLPEKWWLDEKIKKKKSELKLLLENEFGKDKVFVIKDPRISILLPLYLETFDDLNIVPKVIINFRNPIEVADSLKKRDNLSLSKSLLLWMDASLKAELYSRPFHRIFLNYNNLLDSPVETLKQISKLLQLNFNMDAQQENELKKFVEKRLKHHSTDDPKKTADEHYLIQLLFNTLKKINLKQITKTDQRELENIYNLFYSLFRFYNGIDQERNIVLKVVTGSTKTTFSKISNTIENNVAFKINNTNSVSEFTLYPASRRVAIQLFKTVVATNEGKTITLNAMDTNAEKLLNNGIMIFDSDFPWIKFRLTEEVAISKITFSFEYLAFDNFTHRASIEIRNQTEAEYSEKISALEQAQEKLVQHYEDALQNLNLEHEKARKAQETLVNKLRLSVEELISGNNELKRAIEKSDKEHIVLQEQMNHLQTENSNLTDEKKELLKDNKTLIQNNEQLITNNQKVLSDFEVVLSELKNKQQALIHEKDNLLSKYKNDLTILQQNYSRLTEKIELKTSEMADIKQTHEHSLKILKTKNTELTNELTLLNSFINEITQSTSWKLGRAITWPVRKPKEKLKKSE